MHKFQRLKPMITAGLAMGLVFLPYGEAPISVEAGTTVTGSALSSSEAGQTSSNNSSEIVASGSALTTQTVSGSALRPVPDSTIPTVPTVSGSAVIPSTGSALGTATGGALQGTPEPTPSDKTETQTPNTGTENSNSSIEADVTKPSTNQSSSAATKEPTTSSGAEETSKNFVIRIPKNISVSKKQQDIPIKIECYTTEFTSVTVTFCEEFYMTSEEGLLLLVQVKNNKLTWTKDQLKNPENATKKIQLICKRLVPGDYTGCFTYNIKVNN